MMTLYSFSRLIVNEKRNGKESNIEAWKGKESLMISYQCLVWLDAGLHGIVLLLHCVGTRLCWEGAEEAVLRSAALMEGAVLRSTDGRGRRSNRRKRSSSNRRRRSSSIRGIHKSRRTERTQHRDGYYSPLKRVTAVDNYEKMTSLLSASLMRATTARVK